MCGICGKIYFDQTHVVDPGELHQMAATLSHRGPDGDGVWTAPNVGLAHRRLAIIDLRSVADQPMSNEDGTVWITFNGEIYNFLELRRALEAQGHIFRTQSDTEVIVHAYEEYGRACVERLRGMFAFAIWDTRTQTLFLARDRVGKKPLYYFHGHDRFIFASEIKALLLDDTVPRVPDPVGIDHFLALQYIPAPLTAFQGVRKLPAAHWLELRHGRVEIGRYWKLHYTPKREMTMVEAVDELQWRFAEAVRLRLMSDVPLGAFLSGGVDSSAVVAYMAQQSDRPVKTFSVGFEDATFDERPYARMIAERYGTDHTEIVVKAPVDDILPRLVWHYDEPFGDASAIPSYAISELTRQHVTVVLNGDGGDETFAGYDWYILARRLRRGDVIPLWLRQRLAASLQRLPQGWRQRQPLRKLARLAAVMGKDPARRHARWPRAFAPDDRWDTYTTEYRTALGASDPEELFVDVFARTDARDGTDVALDADVNLYLADDLLVKMDRATMAHALEARSPFLDHELMEFVASLPTAFKLQGTQKKRLLKAALRGHLPDLILDRTKMGFSVPLARWFRQELRDMAYDLLLSERARARGYFRSEAIALMLDQHCHEQVDHSAYLWDLLVLELWHRTFVDNGVLGQRISAP
jgi:asparagine synthase (glutamine-hydrolysing)